MNSTSNKSFIESFRLYKSKKQFYHQSIKLIIGFVIIILLLGIIESIFYLSINTRTTILNLFLLTFLNIFIYNVLKYYLNIKSLFGNSTDEKIAIEIGKLQPHISDRLLNSIQLENQLDNPNTSNDLAKHAINKINLKLNQISIKSIFNPISSKLKNSFIFILLFFLITMLSINSLYNAYARLATPKVNYPPPLPFILKSLSGNKAVLGGDTLDINIAGIGDLPDSIQIVWKNNKGINKKSIPLINGTYTHTFNNIKTDSYYWAEYSSPHWFSAWDFIKTSPDTIIVKDRPVIQNITFNIIPPQYTNELEFYHPDNITDMLIPQGSQIKINSIASKTLQSAWIQINDNHNDLYINENKFHGTILVSEKSTISLFVTDQNDVDNINPPHYRVSIIPDSPPDIIIKRPNYKFELDESEIILFDIQTSDDYGFSDAWIEYKIKTPSYLDQDTTTYKRTISELITNVRSQQIIHNWNISNLSLAPEDELHIQIAIADNNSLITPSITYSSNLIGRYPSIEDLFNRIEEDENEIENYSDEINMNMEDIKELTEELELELLKSDDMSWEQQQKSEEILEKIDEVFDQIEKVQQTMEKIQEQAEKNNLVSDDLVEKFSDFQNLLNEMMTPEMQEAMEKMQEAMEEMDPKKMLDALENFEYDMDAFEEQLDRFIEMFELAMAEQKIDEVVKRLEKLVEEQTDIVKELTQNNNIDYSKLASRERRQEESFKSLENIMKEATDAIKPLSEDASQQLSELAQSELTLSARSQINNSRSALQNNDKEKSSQSTMQANESLSEMLEIAQEIQSQFQSDTVDKMIRKFLGLIRNLLFISQNQENLIASTTNLRSRSPKLIETAIKQDKILRQNQQFMIQLTELSKETFHISPQIASAIGKTKISMDRTISKLEQKQTSSAKKEMKKILNGLNEIANLLLESANQMQMSGSGSGMAQLMEQMEKMSQQQQGINQGTMNLPQLGMMAQQQMMEQLQKQQENLKQQLEELLSDNPGEQSGGLSKINEDMEEVIEDFRKKQVDRRTQERQQRILSRMLDNQKSLTQKDYSEKRKAKTGETIEYSGPAGLPENKGEREMLIINAMESALQEGYSKEYQNMMKQYFRSLQKDEINPNK